MNIRTILSVGLRIFALMLFLEAIFTTLSFLSVKDVARENVELLTVSGLYVLVAFITWKFPLTIAKKLTPNEVGDEKIGLSAFDLSRVGIALLALNVIINSLWSVIPAIVALKSDYMGNPPVAFSGVIMLVFGIILLLGNGNVARLVIRS
ncbi:GNAT family acetyltransferase [Enterovibrio sp. ZSDZ35]|uniref:GNAT family acetyltransferase n=1 Tax=Enterovibrio qingdaonensis TaxID=2899818 RepID=A0ABT5QH97_9GAMM|nr:GNAT family acetyltransferase [Enterovibrio sp. ZSDZ35]MDD1780356.1 GNAT family acetyltransferase [Enterovibrio sp. ZSDZ35]